MRLRRRSRLRRKLPVKVWLWKARRLLLWLWRQEGSRGQRTRGLAVGVFVGCFPFFGLQIVLSVALASAVRGNHLLAAAGTWISNPLTYLPLYFLNFQVGILLLGRGPAWPGAEILTHPDPLSLGWAFTSRMLLGSILVGLVASLASSALFWLLLHHREAQGASAASNSFN